jgi:hypothetical protein
MPAFRPHVIVRLIVQKGLKDFLHDASSAEPDSGSVIAILRENILSGSHAAAGSRRTKTQSGPHCIVLSV